MMAPAESARCHVAKKRQRYNPLNERDMSRLRRSAEWSRERLASFRKTAYDLVDQFTGGSYADGGQSGSVPLNMEEMMVNIYQRQLASGEPQVAVETTSRLLKPSAHELELAVNHLITKEMDLGESLNEVVKDAMFCMGVMKIGETPKEHEHMRGFRHDAGQPFADPVAIEDWVHDMSATRYEQVDYAGHKFPVPLEMVLESPLYDKKAKLEIENASRQGNLMTGEADERPETIGSGRSWMQEEYRQKVWLWEMWLPSDNLLVTYGDEHQSRPLWTREFEGPERGPHHLLGYTSVPGNIMPLAPAAVLEDLHDLINRLFIKAGQQADRQKTILAAQNRAATAVSAISQARDGQTILTDVSPELIKEFTTAGVDPNLMTALIQFKQLFNYAAGNMEALGGLGPQSATLGQDKLLTESASERLADMQRRVVKFTTGVTRDLAWYMWRNPYVDMPLTKQLTPTISRDFRWTADSRNGEFFDYNFAVVPYSLRSRSPQEKLSVLNQMVTGIILPMMPILQQQGISFDAFKFLELVSKLSNVPELADIIKSDMGIALNDQDASVKQSPVTQRNYTRTGQPSRANQQGSDQMAMQQFMSKGAQQPAEALG